MSSHEQVDVMERYRADQWTVLGFPTLEHGALTVRRGHGHAAPVQHEAVELVPASQLEGAVEAARAVVRTAQAAFDDVDRGDFADLEPLRLAVRALDRATSGGR